MTDKQKAMLIPGPARQLMVYVAWVNTGDSVEELKFVGVYSTAEIAHEQIKENSYAYPGIPAVMEIRVDS